MPEIVKYVPGTPSWVDLSSPDLEASNSFYGTLFGWAVETDPRPDSGGYGMFTLRGHNVAGLGPAQPGRPPMWSTYITVESADAMAEKARQAGGSVLLEPMDVLDVGRMAVLADPVGAAISIWQPRAHKGADLVNEPGTFCWNELQTRDLERSKEFYPAVFGWSGEHSAEPMIYTEWKLQGNTIAGMMPMPDQVPDDVPAHWSVYFAVEDCAATVDRAKEFGATIAASPTEIPPGIFAVIVDPQGAAFNVLQFGQA